MFPRVRSTHPSAHRRPLRSKRVPRPTQGGWLTFLVAGALALTISGCSSSQAEVATSAETSGAGSTVEQIDQVLFGAFDDNSDESRQRLIDDQAAYEERVVACMTIAGFEYFPPPVDASYYEAPEVDYLSREYAETYGFGYSTSFEEGESGSTAMTEEADADPNSSYVNSLSPGEQTQYYIELYGDQSVWDNINSEEEARALQEEQPELFEPSGCQAEAGAAANQEVQEVWTTYGDEINELYELAVDHPTVQEPLKDWQVCMADHGHVFSTPDDFDTVMDPYMNELYASAVGPADGLTDDDMANMTDEELNELWSQPTQYDQALLAEVQAYEIELAVSSWDCGLTGLYEAYQVAFTELRQDFIESHLNELSGLVES